MIDELKMKAEGVMDTFDAEDGAFHGIGVRRLDSM